MNICSNAIYRLNFNDTNSKIVSNLEKLTSQYSITQIKQFIKDKAIIVNYCGKCEFCQSIKKEQYKKRVQSQLKKSKYNYLITLTFSDSNIETLTTDSQKQFMLNNNIVNSPFSNLSKNVISNIIRNWKKKFNKYYKTKIQFHYFLCGEYGEQSHRAHYHILLMLDYPIPNLEKVNCKGHHYQSKFIESTQFNYYDIEPANQSINTAGYISKYLSKSIDNQQYNNFNSFQFDQIDYLKSQNVDLNNIELLKKKDDLKYILLTHLLTGENLYYYLKNLNFNLIKKTKLKKQRPFIKSSRGLGLGDIPYNNYLSGVINRYYYQKYLFKYEVSLKNKKPNKELKKVLDLYNENRKQNIDMYFFKGKNIKPKKPKYDII